MCNIVMYKIMKYTLHNISTLIAILSVYWRSSWEIYAAYLNLNDITLIQ
jgi:hypothetical protein